MAWSRRSKRQICQTTILCLLAGVLRIGLDFSFISNVFAVAPSNILAYQARILNTNGVPVTDASLSLEFRFYSAVSGGTCLWSNSSSNCDGNTPASTTSRTVILTDGLLTETLGDTSLASPYAAIATSVFAENADVFLEVEVAGEILSPRKRVGAAAYAVNAQTLDGQDASDFLSNAGDTATGTYDFTGSTLAGSSPIVFEGNTANDFETTFTITDPTGDRTITFQNASGTVAYLSDLTSLDSWIDTSGDTMTGTLSFGTGINELAIFNGEDLDLTDGTNSLLTVTDNGTTATLAVNTLSVSSLTVGTDTITDLTGAGLVISGGVLQTSLGTSIDLASETTGTLPVTSGGTGLSSLSAGDIFYGSAANTLSVLTGPASANQVLRSSGSNTFAWSSLAASDLPSDGYASTYVNVSGDTMTGSLTINKDTDDGALSVEGSIFDSNSLDFVGAGSVTSAASSALTLTGNATSTWSIAGASSDLTLSAGRDLKFDDDNLTAAVPLAVADTALNGALAQGLVDAINDVYDVALAGGGSLFTDGGAITYLTATGDNLALGGSADISPFYLNTTTNTLRLGDGISDTNDPTITFYASDATNSGSLSYLDTDTWSFSGGDVSMGGTLGVTGIATFAANVNANGGIDVDDAFVVADGGILTTSQTANFDGTADFDGDVLISDTNVAFDGASTTFTTTGAFTLTPGGAVILGDGGDTLAIDSNLWDVATSGAINIINSADVVGLTIAPSIATTTAIDLSDADIGTALTLGSNDVIVGGATLSSSEFAVLDSGIALADETTGNYIATLADAGSADLTITGSGSENATVTIDIADDALDFTELSDALTLDTATTISGNTLSINTDSNNATNINTGTSNAAVAIGGGFGTVAINSSDWDINATGDMSGIGTFGSDGIATFAANVNANGGIDVDDAFVVADGGILTTSQTANFDGATDFDSTIDATGGVFQGTNVLVFEGLTANDFETTFAITDPTADQLITFQNGTGTVAFLTDVVGGSSLFTDGGTVSYLTSTTDDLAIGNTSLVAPFSVDVDINTLRIGDGANDENSPTITFYASDAIDSGSLSYLEADGWFFSGGNVFIGNDTESISATEFSLSGNDVYLEDALGVNGTIYGDDGSKILGEFNQDIGILNSGGTLTTGVTGMFKNTFTGTLSAARQDVGLYASVRSNVSVTSQDYTLVGDYVRTQWDPNAPGITPTGSANIYGRLTDFTTGNITNLDNLIGHRFSIGEGDSIGNTTISNAGFIDGRFQPGSGTAVTNFKGIYLSADDNAGAGTINDARGLDVSFTDADAASFTSAYGVYVSEVQATNAYGVYVASVTGSSNDYSVYTADNAGNAAFLDNVFVGATSEDITDGTFSVGGDDLFVSGQLGVSDLMRLETNFAGFAGGFFNDGGLDDRQGVYVQGCIDASPTSSCNLLELRDGDGTVIGAIEGNGAGGVTNASSGSDYAELFPGTRSSFSTGDVLALGSDGNVRLAAIASEMVGALSISPNTLGNWMQDWEVSDAYVPVALLGQVPVKVSDEGGSVAVGDYLTLSSVPGVVKKATGVGFMIGRALEPFVSGTGIIKVFIQPTWHGLDMILNENGTTTVSRDLKLRSLSRASSVQPVISSPLLSLHGSVWNGTDSEEKGFSLSSVVTATDQYRLSIQNTTGSEIAYLTSEGTFRVAGDLVVGGRLYPSNQGIPQTEKYIYYEGTSGPGGDFMRTNASGWATGSYDFAEMFPSDEALEAGDVVVFGSVKESVQRSSQAYDARTAGIVSTRPGFLTGENTAGQYPVALAGRVPTRVTLEGGPIAVGDPLTTSSESGTAMKATKAGPIVGYALEPFDGSDVQDGKIIAFVQAGYYGGGPVSTTPGASTTASQLGGAGMTSLTSLNMEGAIFMNGSDILNVRRLSGLSDRWSLEEDGTIKTEGLVKNVITTYQNTKVEAVALVSPEVLVTLVGTSELQNGETIIRFEDVQPDFNDVISTVAPIRIMVTPNSPVSLYVFQKDSNGFTVRQSNGLDSGVTFDWMAVAYRKDYEPKLEESLPEGGTTTDISSDASEGEVVDSVTDDSDLTQKNLIDGTTIESTDEAQVISETDVLEPADSRPVQTEQESHSEIMTEMALPASPVQPNDSAEGNDDGASADAIPSS